MFRGHDDPVADVRLRQAREHCGEIDDKLAVGMGDDCQVGVGAFSDLWPDLQAYFLCLCHVSLCL